MKMILGKYNLPNYYVTKLQRTFQRFSFAPTGMGGVISMYNDINQDTVEKMRIPGNDCLILHRLITLCQPRRITILSFE